MELTSASVIFDVDGTLVDTNYEHTIAWRGAFRQHGIDVPAWEIHRHVGMGGDQLVAAVAGEAVERERGDDLRAAHDTRFRATLPTTSVLAGASRLLADLAAAGQRVALASSSGAQELDHHIDALDAREHVIARVTAADVSQTKPCSDLVTVALERLGTGDAVMVGDSPWDVYAAAAAGLKTIGVLTGGFTAAELREAGAVHVVRSVAELRPRTRLAAAVG